MNNKYLIIKGIAGLGNRLATLSKAIEYATITKRKIYVDWSDPMVSFDGKSVFDKYFKIINIPMATHEEMACLQKGSSIYPSNYQLFSYHNLQYWHYRHDISKYFDRVKPLLIGSFYKRLLGYWHILPERRDGLKHFIMGMFDSSSFELGQHLGKSRNEKVVVFADYIPPFQSDLILKHVTYQDDYLNNLEILQRKFIHNNSVGIHVRSTDKHPRSRSVIKKIVGHLKSHNLINRPIFLSTDNQNVLIELQSRLPNVMIIRDLAKYKNNPPHLFSESTQNANLIQSNLEESLQDMYLLSKCEYIFFQSNSSFTVLPRALHSNPNKCINWDD